MVKVEVQAPEEIGAARVQLVLIIPELRTCRLACSLTFIYKPHISTRSTFWVLCTHVRTRADVTPHTRPASASGFCSCCKQGSSLQSIPCLFFAFLHFLLISLFTVPAFSPGIMLKCLFLSARRCTMLMRRCVQHELHSGVSSRAAGRV